MAFGRRNDARASHGAIEAKRAADGQHPVTDVELVRNPPLRLDVQVGFDLEHGEVAAGIGAEKPSLDFVFVTFEPDHNAIGVLDDVVIGDHVAFFFIDDHAGTQFDLWRAGVMRLPPRGRPWNPSPPRRVRKDWTLTTAGETAVVAMRNKSDARLTSPASSSFASASVSARARPDSQAYPIRSAR